MISGLDLNATVDFTIPSDKKNPTIWKLGVLPSNLYARIVESGSSSGVNSAYSLIQCGLKGWENFNIDYSTEEVFINGEKVNAVPMSKVSRIPISIINELSSEIMRIQELTGDEIKN